MDNNWNVVGRDNENGDDDADGDASMTSVNDRLVSSIIISIDAREDAVGRFTESGKRARESFQMMMKEDEPSTSDDNYNSST